MCARVPTQASGEGPTSERKRSSGPSVVTTPWYFSLSTSAMMILDGPARTPGVHSRPPGGSFHCGELSAKNNKIPQNSGWAHVQAVGFIL